MDNERREELKKLKQAVMTQRQQLSPNAARQIHLPKSLESRLAHTSEFDLGYVKRQPDTEADENAIRAAEEKRERRRERKAHTTD